MAKAVDSAANTKNVRASTAPKKDPPQTITVPGNVTVPPINRGSFGVVPAPTGGTSPSPYTGGGSGYGADFSADAGMLSDEDYLAGDAAYQAQLAALLRAVEDYGTDVTAQQTRYGADYNEAVKGLGWMQDDPTTQGIDEGAWNFTDTNNAAGRAFQNQQNDFASRGTLQSSGYATANDNLTRSLNDQLGGINTAKQGFFDELARGQAAFGNENQLAQQQARAEAIARRASSVF